MMGKVESWTGGVARTNVNKEGWKDAVRGGRKVRNDGKDVVRGRKEVKAAEREKKKKTCYKKN